MFFSKEKKENICLFLKQSYQSVYNQGAMTGSGLVLELSKLLQHDAVKKCGSITHQMFHKYLLFTNVGISASLSLTGDVIQQYYEILHDKNRNWDAGRIFRMTTAGVAVGAICHYWYQYLDKHLPGRTLKTVLKKVAIDQLIGSPLYITVFFGVTCTMEKATMEEIKKEINQKWWRLYLAEWVIWPPAQVINFYLLPNRYRVLYDNFVSLGYDVYTSYVKNELPVEDKNNKTETEKEKSA